MLSLRQGGGVLKILPALFACFVALHRTFFIGADAMLYVNLDTVATVTRGERDGSATWLTFIAGSPYLAVVESPDQILQLAQSCKD